MSIEITDEMRKVFWETFNAEYYNGDKLVTAAAEAGLSVVAPLIAAAEREACAQVADMFADENIRMAQDSIFNDPLLRRARRGETAPMVAADWALVDKCTDDGTIHSSMFHAAQNIAAAIRARSS